MSWEVSVTDIGHMKIQGIKSFIPHWDNRTIAAISEPDLWDADPKRNDSC